MGLTKIYVNGKHTFDTYFSAKASLRIAIEKSFGNIVEWICEDPKDNEEILEDLNEYSKD